MSPLPTLAETLLAARIAAKLSQQQVADATGIPRSGVSDIEHDKREVSALELKAFATLFGMTTDALLGDNKERKRPELGVGGPGYVHLNHFGSLIRDAYGHVPYLVGSATRGKQWRDVDVRLILPDDEFDVMFGSQRPFGLGAQFCLLSAAISALGEKYTGLPIDFQFQPQTHANEQYPQGFRQPLGIWNSPPRVDVVKRRKEGGASA